jgi:hypothetical protein
MSGWVARMGITVRKKWDYFNEKRHQRKKNRRGG